MITNLDSTTHCPLDARCDMFHARLLRAQRNK